MSAATYYVSCPVCVGRNATDAKGRTARPLECLACRGTSLVSRAWAENRAELKKRGAEMRRQRIAAKRTLRAEAKRRRTTITAISREELGYEP